MNAAAPTTASPSALAVVLDQPQRLRLSRLPLTAPTDDDLVVDIEWSGISTGTERLLWSGRMPDFPGMGYPLVPGYEAVGRVVHAGTAGQPLVGRRVFVPGARCYGEVRGLFGGASSRVVLPAARALAIDDDLGEQAVLLALAATARHALAGCAVLPQLVVGHGVLGRLLARLIVSQGGTPVVWETDPQRRDGAAGYVVIDPADDDRHDHQCICDASGQPGLLDRLIGRLAPGGEIVLAGFYDTPLQFDFAPAFLREARLRVSAQWQPADLLAVRDLVGAGGLSLAGLITHRQPAVQAEAAYRTAFGDSGCLKMTLDWRDCA